MLRTSRFVLTGGLAVALGVGGVTVGVAWGKPVLPSGANPTPAPSFTFPSDAYPGTPIPYPLASDPQTGTLANASTVDQATSPPGAQPNTTYDQFLTFINRLDTPLSGCRYYEAIGAVQDCDPTTGEFRNVLVDFESWRKMVKIDKHTASGFKTNVAHFINQVDLNLTRDHHMVYYGPTQAAGYVCNHKPPPATTADPTGYFPSQGEINAAIATIRHRTNTVACVAMEYSADTTLDPGNPNPPGTPFTKFWIFGPPEEGGKLLSTVDLDGRGPKAVPNVCTACHGGPLASALTSGPNGTQQFNPASKGDLGAHFLPFDLANFAFARNPQLSQAEQDAVRAEQEKAIFKLNMNVYNIEKPQSDPPKSSLGSLSIQQLIKGWYTDVTSANVSPKFNYDFVPDSFTIDTNHIYAYQNAYAHSCRTCHVAMDNQAFEAYAHGIDGTGADANVCNHVMPNSKVTFDRFWLSERIDVRGQPLESVVPGRMARLDPDQLYYLSFIFPKLEDRTACPRPPR